MGARRGSGRHKRARSQRRRGRGLAGERGGGVHLLDHALDEAALLRVVPLAQAHLALVEAGVRPEDAALTLTATTNDLSHGSCNRSEAAQVWRRAVVGWRGVAGGSMVRSRRGGVGRGVGGCWWWWCRATWQRRRRSSWPRRRRWSASQHSGVPLGGARRTLRVFVARLSLDQSGGDRLTIRSVPQWELKKRASQLF